MEVGHIKLWRKTIEADIWSKPPLYLKVWLWLLMKAYFKPNGNGIQRGQYFTSIDQIRLENSYMVGYRKETPTRKQIWEILEWMRKTENTEYNDNSRARKPHEADAKGYNEGNMIETTKVTHGMIITICKYDTYQCSINTEGNDEKPHEGNNEPEAKRTQGEQYTEEGSKKEKKVRTKTPKSDSSSESFERFYSVYPKKSGRIATEKAWKKLAPGPDLIEKIVSAIIQQTAWRHTAKESGQFYPEWKNPSTWLHQGCWMDENYIQTDLFPESKRTYISLPSDGEDAK